MSRFAGSIICFIEDHELTILKRSFRRLEELGAKFLLEKFHIEHSHSHLRRCVA